MSNKILIIDDDEAVRDAFIIALRKDYEVLVAEDGYKGVDTARTEKPSLIFLDLKMPGMNGVEVLATIREFNTETPIFIVTAFYKEFLHPLEKVANDGISFQLAQKPLSGDQIRAIVGSVI